MKLLNEIKQILHKRLTYLKQLNGKVVRSLSKAPDGRLIISKSHGTVQYYCKTDENKKRIYLDKSNKKLIASLAQKDYDLALQKEIKKQEKKIQKVLKNLPEMEIEDLYEGLHEERKVLVNKHFISKEEHIDQWANATYEGKKIREDSPVFMTEKGEKVRSKSEKIIADKLYALGIPYRYEYPLYLNGFGTIYPDFTILDVKTNEEIYLEHLGMMDDMEYCEKAISKVYTYAKNGIVIGKNLLLTFETKKHPLDIKMIEKILMQLK